MCSIGQCTWKYQPASRRYSCIKCYSFITDRDYIANPKRYIEFRYIVQLYRGPLDGDIIRIPFGITRIWTNVNRSIVYDLSYYTHQKCNWYEYEIEPMGDFVFVRVVTHVEKK